MNLFGEHAAINNARQTHRRRMKANIDTLTFLRTQPTL
jgi:hypothetical protein